MNDLPQPRSADPRPPAPPLETREVCKVFLDFWRRPRVRAVSRVSLRVERGEVFGLLGPNGSGKSTTIKMLLGLLRPTAGHVALFGVPANRPAIRRRVGYLPELTWLHPYLNPVETLDYYGALSNLDRATRRRRTAELLSMFDLDGVAHRPVGEFSKGMARRVGLAQALIHNPDLIILDEPTSGLDPIGSRRIKDLIRTLAAQGRSVLMSSHLLADVADICDRIAILHAGECIAEGTVQSLLQTDPNRFRFTLRLADPASLDAARQALAAFGAGEPVAVDRPSVSLETFFLQTLAAHTAVSAPPDTASDLAAFLGRPPAEPGPATETPPVTAP